MKAEYINAFLEPTVSVIEQTLKLKAAIGLIKKGKKIGLKEFFGVMIGMKGDLSGMVIVSCLKKTALSIAAIMLDKKELNEINDDAKSALCELVNMIIGNVTGKLYEIGLMADVTLPTIVEGKDAAFLVPGVNGSLTVPISTKLGNVDLILFLKDNRNL